jgi:hypothetical protein
MSMKRRSSATADRLYCIGRDNSLRMKAQDLSNYVGKVLRLRDDGSVPPDNPFVGRAGAKPEGPDGLLYVATELVSGGNAPDGTILRIEPVE